jgi:manganese oxidase
VRVEYSHDIGDRDDRPAAEQGRVFLRSGRRCTEVQMKRLVTMMAGFALVAMLLTGCGGDDDNGETTTPSASATTATTSTGTQQEAVPAVVKVSIGDNFYKPKDLTIKRGQSISWRNEGTVAHTVTSDTDSSVKFDSGTLEPRSSAYALKPTTAGKITYYCTIHGKVQSGTVTVTR